jgi:hypothetical protein
MEKNPWIAALLNFLLYGAGYVYNGKTKNLGLALILAWVVLRTADIRIYLDATSLDNWFILMAGLSILQFTFAIDGFRQAKQINSES